MVSDSGMVFCGFGVVCCREQKEIQVLGGFLPVRMRYKSEQKFRDLCSKCSLF